MYIHSHENRCKKYSLKKATCIKRPKNEIRYSILFISLLEQ